MNFFELETIVLLLTLMRVYRMKCFKYETHASIQVAVHLPSQTQSKTVEHELHSGKCG